MDIFFLILYKAVDIYSWALIIYILMSWFPNAKDTGIGMFLARICEPFLEPFRRIIPPLGMIDLSPLVAILVLNMARVGISALAAIF